jgi:hypothetical protein
MSFTTVQTTEDEIYSKIIYKLRTTVGVLQLQSLLPYSVDTILDDITRDMVITFSKSIFTKTEKVETVEIYPKTWWDHFKSDYAPSWFLRKFPAEYINIPKQVTVNTPCVHIQHPNPVIKFSRFNTQMNNSVVQESSYTSGVVL